MWGCDHEIWEKSKGTAEYYKRIVTSDVRTTQCEDVKVQICVKTQKLFRPQNKTLWLG